MSIARNITNFKKKEIIDLFKKSRFLLKDPRLDIKFMSGKKDFGRILIVTPKKIGNAPVRNKIRRRIKSIFYTQKLFLNPYDFIILCKKELADVTFDELKNIILKAVEKIKN